MRIGSCAAVVAVSLCSLVSAGEVDGIWTKDDGAYAWSYTGCWRFGTVPDGGVATFWSCPKTMNIDGGTIELAGLLRTGNREMSLTNEVNGIRFVADPSFLINHTSQLTMKGPLVGTGANRLEIGGTAGLKFENLASNFGEVAVLGTTVTLPATSGTILFGGNVTVSDGTIAVTPTLATGASAVLTMCDGAGSRFTSGPGFGRISLNHGSGAGVTLTLPAVTVSNGALAVNSTTSLAALGVTDKLLLTAAPAVENGMVTPALAIYDGTASKVSGTKGSYFATYDSTQGLVPAADPVAWDASADQSAAIVRLSDSATVSAPKSVYAMYWDAATDRKLTLESDLKILSGGLIVNCPTDATVTGMAIEGAGAIDFGDKQGVLRGAAVASTGHRNPAIALKVPIKGTKGVVFSGSPAILDGAYVGSYNYSLTKPAAWTGPTVVANGVKLIPSESLGSQFLPAGGDVYLIGGDHRGGASIRLTASTTFDQNFVIAGGGNGSHGSGNTGPFYLGGGNVTITFNGTTRFQDTVYFSHDNSRYVLKFVGKVSGAGRIDMHYGVLEFAGENEYSGTIEATSGGSSIVVSGNGSLGRASVSVTAGALKFNNVNGQTFANDISSTGTLTVDGGHVILTGRVTSAKTVLKNGAIVEIGDNVDLGQVTFEGGSKVLAVAGSTCARVEIGGDGAGDVALTTGLSGASDVPFVKSGTNTVSITKACAIGSSLTVAEGTVKLIPGLMATASFWLDASNAGTVVTNGAGGATAWRSANGNGRVFTYATEGAVGVPGTYPGPQMNGLDTMHFDHTGSSMTWFVCDTSVDIRSIYICMKPYFYAAGTPTTLTPWGWYGTSPEYGLRWATYSTWHDLGFTTNKKRVNGGKTSVPATADGVPLLIGQFNADDSTAPKSMRPSIGGYQTWDRLGCAYNGDIGEVVAFDHELTLDEKKALEQYLSVKWGVYDAAGLWPEVDTSALFSGEVLGSTVELSLVDGAVFDLNGANQTVASLAGAGLITNSSAMAATLTVTGACAFNGVVAANVKLVASGAVNGEVNGTLVANGGTVTVADAEYAPPAAGRLWWFDASEVPAISGTSTTTPGAILTNKYGRVDHWNDKLDGSTYFYCLDNGGSPSNMAQYVQAAEGVRPGLYMNAQVGLCCNQANTPHTIAVVYEFDTSFSGSTYFFCGYGFGDAAMRLYSGKALDNDFNFRSKASFSNLGDHIYVNGKRIEIDGKSNISLPQGELCCYIGTRDPSHTDTNWVNRQFCFGSSCWSKGTYGTKICEAICYDRLLTDDECKALNTYLTNKWNGKTAPKAKVGSNAILGATSGGTLDVTAAAPVNAAKLVSNAGGGTLVGDLMVGRFEYDAENAASAAPLVVAGALTVADGAPFAATNTANLARQPWKLLKADSATGTFTPGGLGARRWLYLEGDAEWGIAPRGFIMLIR